MKEDMKELQDFICKLQSTGSKIEKGLILSQATQFQKTVLEFLFNPYKVTGISNKKLNSVKYTPQDTRNRSSILDLMGYLTVHDTGSYDDVLYVKEVAYNSGYEDLVLSIVKKDLRLGVNATTLNKVFGKGFIPTFGVQLAERYFDNPDKYVKDGDRFIITEKLDGVRCVLIFDDRGIPHFYARSGREFLGLLQLKEEAERLPKYVVFDGELLIDSEGKSNDLYRDTMSVVGSDGIKTGVVFHVFDCLTKEGFIKGHYDRTAAERKRAADLLLKDCRWIQTLPVLYDGTDKSKIDEIFSYAVSQGAEGIMININSFPYVTRRTEGLLKVKRFKECEAVVRSVELGTGKNSGRLGAVIVDIKDKEGIFHRVRVGSGFKDEQRDDYFLHQDKILGKVVEIGYFEVTKNKADSSLSLRFPTWLDRIRIDKTEDDMTCV